MSKDKSKIVNVFGGSQIPFGKQQLEEFKASVPLIVEYLAIAANLQRVKFDALIKEGFTPIEALELCKNLF